MRKDLYEEMYRCIEEVVCHAKKHTVVRQLRTSIKTRIEDFEPLKAVFYDQSALLNCDHVRAVNK